MKGIENALQNFFTLKDTNFVLNVILGSGAKKILNGLNSCQSSLKKIVF